MAHFIENLEKLSNERTYNTRLYIEKILERTVTIDNRNGITSAILTPFEIHGLPKSAFDQAFPPPVIISESPPIFTEKLTGELKKGDWSLLETMKLSNTNGFKIRHSGVTICSIYSGRLSKYEMKTLISPRTGDKVCFLNVRYYLPMMFKWFIEKRFNIQNLYSRIVLMKLLSLLPISSMDIIKRSNPLAIEDSKKYIISGIPAVMENEHGNGKEYIRYPLIIITDDLEKITNGTDHKIMRLNTVSLERYHSMAIVFDNGKPKYYVLDYALFNVIGSKNGFTDTLTTALVLSILGEYFSGSDFGALYYSKINYLKKSGFGELSGSNYGSELWRGYYKLKK